MDRDAIIKYTADVVVLNESREVLLIKRAYEPFEGMWAMPGGHVDEGETAVQAAVRELAEETGIVADGRELLFAALADAPGRDPRGRYVSAVYTLQVGDGIEPKAGDDAAEVRFWPVDSLPPLAFDHGALISLLFL